MVGAIGLFVLLLMLASVIFIVLRSGKASSTGGTFFRGQDGWYYWREVALLVAIYLLFCVGPFLAIWSKNW